MTYPHPDPAPIAGGSPIAGGAPVAAGGDGATGERVIGHPAVDAALRALAEVTDAPPVEQLPAYQAAHRTLREVLASIDEADGGQGTSQHSGQNAGQTTSGTGAGAGQPRHPQPPRGPAPAESPPRWTTAGSRPGPPAGPAPWDRMRGQAPGAPRPASG